MSSYLGGTAANLRKVFDFIESTSTVALFDEFDALGKERADSGEHGELKRVVSAVLQMLNAIAITQMRSLVGSSRLKHLPGVGTQEEIAK